eukprot:1752423-Prorocentrum_lima.AAC.1
MACVVTSGISGSAAQSVAAAMRRAGKTVKLIHATTTRTTHGQGTRDTAQGCVAAAVHQWGTRALQAAES